MNVLDKYQQALDCIDQGNLHAAKIHLLDITEEHPHYLKALNKLGVVFAELQQYETAKNTFLKVISIDPEFAPGYNNLGNIVKHQGQIAKAIEYYQKAIACDPDFDTPHNNLAVIFKEQGNYKMFVKELKIAHRMKILAGNRDGILRKILSKLRGEKHL